MSMPRLPTLKQDYLPLLKIAIPLILTGMLQGSTSFFENFFLAHLGEETLAAGALVAWFFYAIINLLFGILNSINILVAHKHGAKDKQAIIQVLRDGLLLIFLLFLPSFLLLWYASSIFVLLGQKQSLADLANLYLHGIAWGILPMFVLIVLFEFLIGLGHTRVTMSFTILSIPFYIFFSYVLIFGLWGFPKIGIAGAGWGIAIGDWITASGLAFFLWIHPLYRSYLKGIFHLRKPIFLGEIIRIGMPLGLMYCIEVFFFFVLALLMGLINVQSLAANQLVMQFLGPLMGIIFSLAQAVTVLMGHRLGAKAPSAAQQVGIAGMILSASLMSLVAIFYWCFPNLIIATDFKLSDPQNLSVIHLATQFLFVAAFFQIIEAMRIACFGALRALKDTKFTLLTSIFGFWLIALPIGYGLSIYLHHSGAGFWWGLVLGACLSLLLLYYRFKYKMKIFIVS